MRFIPFSILILLISSCAQIVPLTGGDMDKTPPKVISESPANQSLNVSGKTVTLKFDEYVQLKDVFNQLIITPQVKVQPEINVNGKAITITFSESLQENTTYKLFFGNSICDITEGNPIPDYEYTFSTGNYLDTLKLSGTFIDAYSHLPVKDAWAMLYFNAKDSIVFTTKPDYLAKTDAQGQYTIKGLKKGAYKAIALYDKNKNYLYDNGELFGFSDSLITLPGTSNLSISLFTEKNPKTYIKSTSHPNPEKIVSIFNSSPKSINSVTAYSKSGEAIKDFSCRVSRFKDTIYSYITKPEKDSVYIKVTFDNNQSDSSLVTFLNEKQLQDQFDRKRLPLELTSTYKNNNVLPYYTKALKLTSSFLIANINKSNLILKENGNLVDTSKVSVIKGNTDSIYIYYKWKEASEYALVITKNFLLDHYNRTNDSIGITFKTNSKEDYGTLKVNLSGLHSGNYLFQVLNSTLKVVYEKTFEVLDNTSNSSQKKNAELLFLNVLPETYRFRIIVDTNNDGTFTPGEYLNKTQAEEVIISDQTIKIISDWDNELNWEIKK